MAIPKAKTRYTPQEYYALERDAAYKSDYYDGEIFAMSGGTSVYSLICANVVGALWHRLRGKPCTAYESNLRLKVESTGLRTYPDASVYCAPLQYDPEDPEKTTALNATAVFEVLSPSTEGYDRGLKSLNYRQVTSLKAYVLISQDEPHVEVFARQPDGSWLLREANDMGASVTIPGIDVDLPLAEIYGRIEFTPSSSQSSSAPAMTPK